MQGSKEFILNTAYILFLEKSYKAVTIKELMDKTNFTKGAFYHHFQSKEQIFREIIDTYFKNFTNVDFGLFSKNSLAEFINDHNDYNRRVGKELKQLNSKASKDVNHYSLIFEASRLLPDFRKKVDQHLQAERSAWLDVIQNALGKGEIRSKLTALQLAELFINLSDGTALQLFMSNKVSQINKIVSEKWQDLYTLIKV